MVYLGGYHTEGGLIMRQAAGAGPGSPPHGFSGDGLATSEFGQIAGKAADGTLFTFTPDPRKDAKPTRPIVEAFRASGFEPEGYTLNSYATDPDIRPGRGHGQKRQGEGPQQGRCTRASSDTLLGTVEFDKNGDPKDAGLRVLRVEERRQVRLREIGGRRHADAGKPPGEILSGGLFSSLFIRRRLMH